MKNIFFTVVVIAFVLSACGTPTTSTPEPTMPPSPTNTSVPAPTETPLPTATLLPTETPTPISTFTVSEMSNPALDIIDLRITVQGDLVEAIFYLRDVPPELTFQRKDVAENSQEYVWEICVDTDNNKKTGSPWDFSAGSDYCLSAMNFKSGDTPKIVPIEQGVQVNVWAVSGNGGSLISFGSIEVDTEGNTIKLFGKIPGITNTSQFYYKTFDINPGAKSETDSGQLIDRVTIEK